MVLTHLQQAMSSDSNICGILLSDSLKRNAHSERGGTPLLCKNILETGLPTGTLDLQWATLRPASDELTPQQIPALLVSTDTG